MYLHKILYHMSRLGKNEYSKEDCVHDLVKLFYPDNGVLYLISKKVKWDVILLQIEKFLHNESGDKRKFFNILVTIAGSGLDGRDCRRLVWFAYIVVGTPKKDKKFNQNEVNRWVRVDDVDEESEELQNVMEHPTIDGPNSNAIVLHQFDDHGFKTVQYAVFCAAKKINVSVYPIKRKNWFHLRRILGYMSRIGFNDYTGVGCIQDIFGMLYPEYADELQRIPYERGYEGASAAIMRIFQINNVPDDIKRKAFGIFCMIAGSKQPADRCCRLLIFAYVVAITPSKEKKNLKRSQIDIRAIIKEYSDDNIVPNSHRIIGPNSAARIVEVE